VPLIWRIIAGKDLQRDDLVASVDLLVGRRVLAGAELPELRASNSVSASCGFPDCFAEPVIGRAFAGPVGSP